MQNQKLRTTLTETQAQVAGMSNDIQGIKNALVQHSEVLAAIIAILGEDTVTGEIDRLRAQRQAQQEQQQADGVKKLVEQGILKVTTSQSESGTIVGKGNGSDSFTADMKRV